MAASTKKTSSSKTSPKRPPSKPFAATGAYRAPVKKVDKSYNGVPPITGDANRRLEPRDPSALYPSTSVPMPSQIQGSDSVVTDQRLAYFKLTRYSPLRTLTPELLGQYLDLFEQGYLRYLALLEYYIAKRDPILSTVIAKRVGSVKRLKLVATVVPNLPPGKAKEAEQHRDALQWFYDNLRCTSAVDQNLNSGKGELIEQMMGALAFKWSVHELIFKPGPDGLTARFNHIPLWFFENRRGKLRFLEADYQIDGRDLVEGSFMVTTGPGLMEPCAVAYLYKTLALKWYLRYIESHASPVIVGKTNAPRGSSQFNALEKALKEVVDRLLLNLQEEYSKIDISAQGELPYMPLVDEMNRMMATVWRGADLSTISGKTSQGGQGALLQGKEEHALQSDDGERISETLNFQVDPQVIAWHFGEGTTPLAYIKLVVPPLVDNTAEIAVTDALNRWGVKQGERQVLETLGRSPMPDGDTPIAPPPVAAPGGGAGGKATTPAREYENEIESANELGPVDRTLLENAKTEIAAATGEALLPLAQEVDALLALPPEALPLGYRRFKHGLPDVLDRINRHPANAEPLQNAAASGWFNGLLHAEVARGA